MNPLKIYDKYEIFKNILTFLLLSNGMADLASPTPFTVTQPNGIKIDIYNRGIISKGGMNTMNGR